MLPSHAAIHVSIDVLQCSYFIHLPINNPNYLNKISSYHLFARLLVPLGFDSKAGVAILLLSRKNSFWVHLKFFFFFLRNFTDKQVLFLTTFSNMDLKWRFGFRQVLCLMLNSRTRKVVYLLRALEKISLGATQGLYFWEAKEIEECLHFLIFRVKGGSLWGLLSSLLTWAIQREILFTSKK